MNLVQIFSFGLALPLAGAVLINYLLANIRFAHEPLHATVEVAGSFIAFSMLLLIQLAQNFDSGKDKNRGLNNQFAIAGISSMAVLDAFHAAVHVGNTFVWLHSLATFVGGLFFALAWLERPLDKKALRVILISSTLLGLISVIYHEHLPAMLASNGEFSFIARFLNISGGICFIISFLYFLKKYKKDADNDSFYLTSHTLLFGTAGLIFEISILWDLTWWWWHALRLLAYSILVHFCFNLIKDKATMVNSQLNDKANTLEKLNEFNSAILNFSEFSIISSDTEGTITSFSNAAEKMLGYSAEEMIGKQTPAVFHDLEEVIEYAPIVSKAVGKTIEPGFEVFIAKIKYLNEPDQKEWTYIHKDGRRFPVLLAVAALKDDREEIYGYLGIAADISEKKKFEKLLEEKAADLETSNKELASLQERLQLTLKSARIGSWEWRINSGVVLWSDITLDIFGLEKKDFNNDYESFERNIVPEDKEKLKHAAQNTFEHGSPYQVDFKIIRSSDNELRYLKAEATLHRDELGQPKYMLGVVWDITETTVTNLKLKENEEILRLYAKNTPAAVAMFDTELRYIAYSKRWVEDYKIDSDLNLTGRKHYDVFPEIPKSQPEWVEIHKECLAGNEYKKEEDKFVRADGSVYYLKYEILPWRKTDGSIGGIIMFTENITAMKNYQVDLESSNESLSQFAHIASHDLQEPLRTVEGYTSLLVNKLNQMQLNDPKILKYQNFITDATSRMRELIKDILNYSRVGKGNNHELINLKDIIDMVRDSLEAKIRATNTELIISSLPQIMGNKTELYQLFLNLISNAIKFVPKERTAKIEISCIKLENEMWEFSITDNGIGIAEEYQEKIFEIFQRLNFKGDYEGNGIGLAICKKIVENHGGKIWLKSKLGEGSTFIFSLRTNSTKKHDSAIM